MQKLSLKERLEWMYDVPFITDSGVTNSDPWYTIAPYSDEDSLFVIRLTFRNALRLKMDFEPQKYSANLVRSMGKAEAEKSLAFCSFATILSDKGGKIEFTINDVAANPINSDNWPEDWEKVRIRVTVIPISELDNPITIPYSDIADEWGSIFMGMVLSLLNIVPLEGLDDVITGHKEGNKVSVLTNKYERNPINRILCIKRHGHQCQACGFDFYLTYGEIGLGFIHVHHIVPVSQMGENYIVDPLIDLAPVCPNCHSMLHIKDPPYIIAELKTFLEKNQYKLKNADGDFYGL